MRSLGLAIVIVLALPSLAFGSPHGRQTLFLDAEAVHASSGGPGAGHVGHRQAARGVLRDRAGRAIGRFSYACTWIRIPAPGDALERCSASGRTPDGRLRLAGPARASAQTHAWHLVAGSGAYRGARGTVLVRDLTASESLLTLRIAARSRLHAGVVARPAVNVRFLARADLVCRDASARLAALPPFPFGDFDPLNPDPTLLPQVGAFFTGPGDPRGILRAAITRLRALGRPPADRRTWRRMLRARGEQLAVIQAQDAAALAGDVPAFLHTVHATAFRRLAIAATVFGASDCVF